MAENPVVVLAGLPGSGKTYLMAEFCSKHLRASDRGGVYWYEPTAGESVDNLFSALGAAFALKSSSVVSKSKELAAFLQGRKAVLVIDNFENVELESYRFLLSGFEYSGALGRLVLLSQKRLSNLKSGSDPYHVNLAGFSGTQIAALLSLKGVEYILDGLVRDLLEKTDGLPLAVALFCVLVNDLGYDPADLLRGIMTRETRITNWFDRIFLNLSQEVIILLTHLTVEKLPFNMGVVQLFGKILKIRNVEEAFSVLLKHYIVTKQSPYRWRIHSLIAEYGGALLGSEERRRAHGAIGRYFLRGLKYKGSKLFGDDILTWMTRAYGHLIESDYKDTLALDVLSGLAKTAKSKGYQRLLLELTADAIERCPQRDRWIDYHHAQAALALGYPDLLSYCHRTGGPTKRQCEVGTGVGFRTPVRGGIRLDRTQRGGCRLTENRPASSGWSYSKSESQTSCEIDSGLAANPDWRVEGSRGPLLRAAQGCAGQE